MNDLERAFAIELGRRVSYARRNMKLSQQQLAESVGSYRQLISRLECGRLVASAWLLERCAVALNVPLRALVPRTTPRAAA